MKADRKWMKCPTRIVEATENKTFREVAQGDAEILGRLMDASYAGTIDHEGESSEECVDEMVATLQGKYGEFIHQSSYLMVDQDRAISASLVTLYLGKPLLAFSMTLPEAQRQGHARFLIERSLSALSKCGYPEIYLVVTNGNPAEVLYQKIGFVSLGPAIPKQPPPI